MRTVTYTFIQMNIILFFQSLILIFGLDCELPSPSLIAITTTTIIFSSSSSYPLFYLKTLYLISDDWFSVYIASWKWTDVAWMGTKLRYFRSCKVLHRWVPSFDTSVFQSITWIFLHGKVFNGWLPSMDTSTSIVQSVPWMGTKHGHVYEYLAVFYGWVPSMDTSTSIWQSVTWIGTKLRYFCLAKCYMDGSKRRYFDLAKCYMDVSKHRYFYTVMAGS